MIQDISKVITEFQYMSLQALVGIVVSDSPIHQTTFAIQNLRYTSYGSFTKLYVVGGKVFIEKKQNTGGTVTYFVGNAPATHKKSDDPNIKLYAYDLLLH